MKNLRKSLEDILSSLIENSDLLQILGTHFEARDYDNKELDYYAKVRYWEQFTTLYYQILKNAKTTELKLEKIVKKLYEEENDD